MKVTLTGIDDVNDMLSKIAPRHAMNIMRSTIHGVANVIRDEARSVVPRDSGTLAKAIRTKRGKLTYGRIKSDVVVTKAAYYWRFLEYGQGPDGVEYAMFMKSVEKVRPDLNRIFVTEFGKKWEAALARAAKRAS
jgi:HK97 gp10 family phage protein